MSNDENKKAAHAYRTTTDACFRVLRRLWETDKGEAKRLEDHAGTHAEQECLRLGLEHHETYVYDDKQGKEREQRMPTAAYASRRDAYMRELIIANHPGLVATAIREGARFLRPAHAPMAPILKLITVEATPNEQAQANDQRRALAAKSDEWSEGRE